MGSQRMPGQWVLVWSTPHPSPGLPNPYRWRRAARPTVDYWRSAPRAPPRVGDGVAPSGPCRLPRRRSRPGPPGHRCPSTLSRDGSRAAPLRVIQRVVLAVRASAILLPLPAVNTAGSGTWDGAYKHDEGNTGPPGLKVAAGSRSRQAMALRSRTRDARPAHRLAGHVGDPHAEILRGRSDSCFGSGCPCASTHAPKGSSASRLPRSARRCPMRSPTCAGSPPKGKVKRGMRAQAFQKPGNTARSSGRVTFSARSSPEATADSSTRP